MWTYENKATASGYRLTAGVDEAGRGPLAGPVVSAAVILPENYPDYGINDSKKLTPLKRQRLFTLIMESALAVSVGIASSEEIDAINILQASLKSMKRAVEALSPVPDYLLIDGKFTIPTSIPQKAIIKGDSKSISIAAASIIAKVTRDDMMLDLHKKYPKYGFDRHKGYPTQVHKQAILDHGPCPAHRRTFRGVKDIPSESRYVDTISLPEKP